MNHQRSCVLLADRHHGLRDSVRGLLETAFYYNGKSLSVSIPEEKWYATVAARRSR